MTKVSKNYETANGELQTLASPKEKGITSKQIAEIIKKRHDHVIRDIRILIKRVALEDYFSEACYKDKQNKKDVCITYQ